MILRPCPFPTGHLPHVRYTPPPRLRSCIHLHGSPLRAFTTTFNRSQQTHQTHYDVLGVPPSVSPSALKKRFYVLSKENHPDLHPNSKEHKSRFQKISESYTVLANPDKRRQYDRDVMRNRPSPGGQRGSYAGSRAPTGLSKRRSAFRGPPPSYFGGRPNRASSQSQSQSQSTSSDSSTSEPAGSAYAWGPEPQFQQTTDFNPQPVFRTQTVEDQRRIARNAAAAAAAAAQAEYEGDGDFWARFVMITATVLVGVIVGTMAVGIMDSRPKAGGLIKGDGTLRRQDGGKKKEGD